MIDLEIHNLSSHILFGVSYSRNIWIFMPIHCTSYNHANCLLRQYPKSQFLKWYGYVRWLAIRWIRWEKGLDIVQR